MFNFIDKICPSCGAKMEKCTTSGSNGLQRKWCCTRQGCYTTIPREKGFFEEDII